MKETTIPFGASDSELMEATYFIPQGYHAVIDGNKVIIKKGEEPVSENLHVVAKEYADNITDKIGYRLQLRRAVCYGAQWKKERILNNAIEREVKVDAGGYPYIDVTELYDYDKDRPLAKKGDKVKLIIIMEE